MRAGTVGRIGLVFLAWVAVLGGAPRALAQDPTYEPDVKTYAGETFDFSLEWDTNVWNSSSSSTFNQQERVVVSNDVTSVQLDAFPAAGMTPADCIDLVLDDYRSEDAYQHVREVDTLKTPGPIAGSDGVALEYEAMLEGRTKPVKMVAYVNCEAIAGDGMLAIRVDSRLGIWDEELEIITTLLDSLDAGL